MRSEKQMEKQKGRKWEENRNGNKKETKRKRKQMSYSCRIWGKLSKLSSIPEDFSLDLLTLSLIPCKSPRKYKNSSRQRMGRFGLVCQGASLLSPSRAVLEIPPGKSKAQVQKGTSWNIRKTVLERMPRLEGTREASWGWVGVGQTRWALKARRVHDPSFVTSWMTQARSQKLKIATTYQLLRGRYGRSPSEVSSPATLAPNLSQRNL